MVWKREGTLLSTIGMFDDFGVHVSFQDSKRERERDTRGPYFSLRASENCVSAFHASWAPFCLTSLL